MPHDTPPLVGARIVADVVRRAQAGSSTALVGEPGSGRSRVLAEVAAELRRADCRTARITITSAASATALGVLLALLDRATATRITSTDGVVRADALRSAVAALDLQVLIIDCAEQLDASAAALLEQFAATGIAVITSNTTPVREREERTEPFSPRGAVVVRIPPLTPDELAQLAEQLLDGGIDAELAGALAIASGSLPGPLVETVRDATRAGRIEFCDGLWRLAAPLPTARSLRSRVADRLTVLPPQQRGWVAAVAVARSIADDLAARIADPEVAAAAEQAGWTRHDTERERTTISLPSDAAAVVDSLDDGARAVVLRRLIDATRGSRRPATGPERAAVAGWRLELGEEPDPADSFALARESGIDPGLRERLLRSAIAGGASAHAALAEHLRDTRRRNEAVAMLDAAIGSTASDAEGIALAKALATTTGIVERRSADALAALDRHMVQFGADPELVAIRAGLLLFEARPHEAFSTAEPLIGTPGPAGLVATTHSLGALQEIGETERALRTEAALSSAPPTPGLPGKRWLVDWMRCDRRVSVNVELELAETELAALHLRSVAEHRHAERPQLAYTQGRIQVLRADPRTAVRRLQEADAGSGSWHDGFLPRILAELTCAYALSGDLDRAEATRGRLSHLVVPPVHAARVAFAGAQLAASHGDAHAAVETVTAVEAAARGAGLQLAAFDAAYAALRYGDDTAAARLLALGQLPGGRGRDLQRAHAAAVRTGDPAALAIAAGDLHAHGQRLHAIEAASAAIDRGAVGVQHRLVGWIANAPDLVLPGITHGRTGILTAREREVAALAAGGLSDKAIANDLGVALRTAQTHLTRAMAKLGVHRRQAIAETLQGS